MDVPRFRLRAARLAAAALDPGGAHSARAYARALRIDESSLSFIERGIRSVPTWRARDFERVYGLELGSLSPPAPAVAVEAGQLVVDGQAVASVSSVLTALERAKRSDRPQVGS